MIRFTLRALVISCAAASALAGGAAAAPAESAGQGVTQILALGLAGGGENSYGYGTQGQREGSGVIDLRRPRNRAARREPVSPPAAAEAAQGTQLERPPLEAPAASPEADATGGYFVQVGAFSDLGNARRVQGAVASAGPVLVDVHATGAGEVYRVRVGPWASRDQAGTAQRTLAAIGYSETLVTVR